VETSWRYEPEMLHIGTGAVMKYGGEIGVGGNSVAIARRYY
jgi:hypothetical protein